eukprot:2018313-Amphidinium_carterae.1
MAEPVDAPLSATEQSGKVLTTEKTKLVKHLQSIGGSVLWLVICTRPDMALAYSRIASLITRHPKAAVFFPGLKPKGRSDQDERTLCSLSRFLYDKGCSLLFFFLEL